MVPPARLIDSHIHLWPHTAANRTGHAWMQPDGPLTSQFSVSDYIAANKADPAFQGVVYVETDRHLEKYDPDDADFTWAEQTFEELRWLRRIVEGSPGVGEGFGKEHSQLLRGAVIWAPVDHGVEVFRRYVQKARGVAGEATWKRVKGFRFLFQGIHDEQKFRDLVLSDGLADVLQSLPDLDGGMTFDVGVDTRSGGVWQLEIATEAIRRLRAAGGRGKDTVFILSICPRLSLKLIGELMPVDHMCKPNYMVRPDAGEKAQSDFEIWKACISELSRDDNVYMKLSGGFSEMQKQESSAPWPPPEVFQTMKPWTDVLFATFEPHHIMFGSDWPVCNVGGPGHELSWLSWKAAVETILTSYNLNEAQRDWLWWKTAVQAYRLQQ